MALCEGPRNTGLYVERARSMQAAALLHTEARSAGSGSLDSVEWPLLPTCGTLMLRLSGPKHTLQSFLRLMEMCKTAVGEQHVHEAERLGARTLWPIFVLSHGRPKTAHLNWAAPHVLGAPPLSREPSVTSVGGEQPSVEPASHPVVVVVNPEDEDEYRRHWPSALILSLPEEHRPVGYARFMVKRALEWRSPFFWVCDDNVSAFIRIEVGVDGRARRYTEGALFREALMHIQRHESISAIALAGFLRSNGTEVSKRHSELRGSIKIYKVLLHNSRQCAGVEYVPALTKFEDVAFPRELLLRGRTTLKVQSYAYRAVNTKAGGCDASRASASDDLVHPLSSKLSIAEWDVVARLREWIARDLSKSMPARLRHPDSCKRRRTLMSGGSERKRQPESDFSDNGEADDGDGTGSEEQGQKVAMANEEKAAIAKENEQEDDVDDEGMGKGAPSFTGEPRVALPCPPAALPSYMMRYVAPATGELVGSRIRVWWEGENRWYSGRVRSYSSSRGHFVVYDDGERTFEDLCEARWLHEGDTDSDEERPLRERLEHWGRRRRRVLL